MSYFNQMACRGFLYIRALWGRAANVRDLTLNNDKGCC
ncbi:hypothetical protein DCCM_0250 [Desulfocucumis palustris]|uniref:Uncharacterized protein n=1 Tax=Desulfocucumis palustris TaxID=1898651 RepID=A0A2L2X798_9FIRM|nr:hypothetical protein DCCM_0250 [Desulfocucumis palustris]